MLAVKMLINSDLIGLPCDVDHKAYLVNELIINKKGATETGDAFHGVD